jgi:hypothetical protein
MRKPEADRDGTLWGRSSSEEKELRRYDPVDASIPSIRPPILSRLTTMRKFHRRPSKQAKQRDGSDAGRGLLQRRDHQQAPSLLWLCFLLSLFRGKRNSYRCSSGRRDFPTVFCYLLKQRMMQLLLQGSLLLFHLLCFLFVNGEQMSTCSTTDFHRYELHTFTELQVGVS